VCDCWGLLLMMLKGGLQLLQITCCSGVCLAHRAAWAVCHT
jgi:hypothetical protein